MVRISLYISNWDLINHIIYGVICNKFGFDIDLIPTYNHWIGGSLLKNQILLIKVYKKDQINVTIILNP